MKEGVVDAVGNGSPRWSKVEVETMIEDGTCGMSVREEEAGARASGHEMKAERRTSTSCVSCTRRALSTAAATTLSLVSSNLSSP